ncbi:MAG TPA: CpsB/CapC family capsule biosynthesis tyrosine phosphatase [Bacteroidia bacterium]|nr:CpsB/CapC family capsule biosynthesis tyrosine phosphatase [Bacteroidia bacterium]
MSFLQRIFGGQSSEAAPFGKLRVDIHSHLIPGIDDGSSSMEESMEMIKALHALGYRKLITTPHIMSDAYRNTPEGIRKGVEQLRQGVKAIGLDIELEGAAEYYLDDGFSKTMGQRELLTFGGDKKYLLVETSYVAKPMGMHDVIFELITKGYTPVLAHPERYQYLWSEDAVEEVRLMRNRGMMIQVNLTSFGGRYSKRATTIACELAKEDLIDFIGTDLHRPLQLETLRKAYNSSKELRQLVDGERLLNTGL